MEDKREIISVLKEDICIQGVSIKEHKLYKDLSDMNISEQYISDYSNSLHNFLKAKGSEEAEKKVLLIFRINPLVAVRIIESCSLVKDVGMLEYSIKPIFSNLQGDIFLMDVILNDNKIPYVTLLIEAIYHNSITWEPKMFLEYARQEDLKLHKKGIRAKYFNPYNIKHIIRHIPENKQIEFINWFWDSHCYAAKKYIKETTFAGSRVSIIMQDIPEGAIWRHLENAEKENLSEREKAMINREEEEIRRFVDNVFSEGRHMEYVKIIIGEEDFCKKLNRLMKDSRYSANYSFLCEQQKLYEEKKGKERKTNTM